MSPPYASPHRAVLLLLAACTNLSAAYKPHATHHNQPPTTTATNHLNQQRATTLPNANTPALLESPNANTPALLKSMPRLARAAALGAAVAAAAPLNPAASPLLALAARATAVAPVSRQQKWLASLALFLPFVVASAIASILEDRAEAKRVKEEMDRLDKLQQEYRTEDSVFADQDVMASLRKRMGNSTNATATSTGGGEAGETGPLGGVPPSPPSPTPPPPPQAGGAALAEPPASEQNNVPGATDADIERLKRMFGNTE